MANQPINTDALISDIRECIINRKANACPMAVRLAWHSSGTFDKNDGSGGSNGAGMRFPEGCEYNDGANAGLGIMQDMLQPVKDKYPHLSYSDIWTFAGALAPKFLGGPKIEHEFCRTDIASASGCPPNGRLPDASQGAQHLRDVFYRMGFNDQEIVALSGAHTLGRCHRSRSGFDGPWTRHPLKFDNQYFKNILGLEWTPKKWDGPLQYEDASGELMMLPTDLALRDDPEFRVWVEKYAADEKLFFDDFANAYAKLMRNGCPAAASHKAPSEADIEFREAAMHGSLDIVKKHAPNANINGQEVSSGRTALHKAAFWGHSDTISFLIESKANLDIVDFNGDSALHDACRFGHLAVVKLLLQAGAKPDITNNEGRTPLAVATLYKKSAVVEEFGKQSKL